MRLLAASWRTFYWDKGMCLSGYCCGFRMVDHWSFETMCLCSCCVTSSDWISISIACVVLILLNLKMLRSVRMKLLYVRKSVQSRALSSPFILKLVFVQFVVETREWGLIIFENMRLLIDTTGFEIDWGNGLYHLDLVYIFESDFRAFSLRRAWQIFVVATMCWLLFLFSRYAWAGTIEINFIRPIIVIFHIGLAKVINIYC